MEYNSLGLDWIDDLKQRADIVSVVSSYVSLSPKAGKYWACCPFHSERTPSFAVDANRGTWYCFGACHEGGDAISFEMKVNDIGFSEAVMRLAKRVGIKVPEGYEHTDGGSKDKERAKAMLVEAARYYRTQLQNSSEAQAYLKRRGISERTAGIFGLGYSPNGDGIISHLSALGYQKKEMREYSLLGETDGRYYDFFCKRLIVPIFDAYGSVIAFGGRIIEKQEGIAKYKNSRENKLFIKNRTLYGMNFVKKAKIGNPISDLILVEGYMDVIGLYQAGVKNVVASMGTALTDKQAKIIKSMVGNVYICYDGDFAGQKSTLRGLEILKENGLDVKVISLPEGKDPDEMVRKGVEPFLQCKNKALPLYEYLLNQAELAVNMASPAGKTDFAKKALEIVKDLEPMERDIYLNDIASKSGLSVNKLSAELSKTQTEVVTAQAPTEVTPNPLPKHEAGAYINACRFVLNYLLSSADWQERLFDIQLLTNETHRIIYGYILECLSNGRKPMPSTVYNLEECDSKEVEAVITYADMPDAETYYTDCIRLIKIKSVRDELAVFTKLYTDTLDAEKLEYIKARIIDLQTKLSKLKKS